MRNYKIYLCDCAHNYLGMGTHMLPLNIGYIASYAKGKFPAEIDIKLFKYPQDFINQFKKDNSDLVGFSNYAWNADLNGRLSDMVKSISPKTVVVFGGPNINYSECGYRKFFATHSSVDFYIPYEGEMPFENILKLLLGNGLCLSKLKCKPIDGVISYDNASRSLIQGESLLRIKDLDSIPSPYLTGMLDEFFEVPLIPIMETNRGCPYTCTFCAQGISSRNRVVFFDMERVKEEIKYIVERMKHTNMMTIADANFGIAERDLEIARFLADIRRQIDKPRKFNLNWAKNQPKLCEFSKILTNFYLVISLQTMDETVLKNIKRQNIKLSVFKEVIDKTNEAGGISGVELIAGLPGETRESHLGAIRKLFDWNVSFIICYHLVILEGTEMALDKEKNNLGCKIKYRLIDHSFGKYDDITSFEIEEGVRSTSTMSEEDILFFRPVHWLIQFLWNFRFHFDLLKYMQSQKINPLDYIIRLTEDINKDYAPSIVREIFNEFKTEARQEWFDSAGDAREFYSRPHMLKVLKDGRAGGKMNFKYIFRVLLEAKEEFQQYLYLAAVNHLHIFDYKKEVPKDILNFASASIIDFNKDWDEIRSPKSIECKYDILEWKKSGYKKPLEEYYCKDGIRYNFYLPYEQQESLKVLLRQFYNESINVTLRKMAEYMDVADLAYKVQPTEILV